jgi:hypothetical protein
MALYTDDRTLLVNNLLFRWWHFLRRLSFRSAYQLFSPELSFQFSAATANSGDSQISSTADSQLTLNSSIIKSVSVTWRLTVSQSVSLGVEPHLGLMPRYLLLFDSCGLVFVGRPLWREDGSVESQPTFRNNISSCSNSKPSKKPREADSKHRDCLADCKRVQST